MLQPKKILLLCSIIFICCGKALFAQDGKVDSLESVLKSVAQDSNKVNTLNLLAWEMAINVGDYEKTLTYCNEAITVADAVDFKKGKAKAYNIIGVAYMFQGDYPKAIENYESSLKVKEEIGDKKGIAGSYSNIGLVYMYQGEYAKALKNFNSSKKMEEELADTAGIAGSYNNIGIIYEDLGNYPEALNNYLASVRLKQQIGDQKGMANTLSNIANIKELQRSYKEALEYHRASLKIRNTLGDNRGIADCYSNMGNVYKELNNFPEAFRNHKAALKIYEETGNQSGIGLTYNNMGLIYSARGDSALVKDSKSKVAKDFFSNAISNYEASIKIREQLEDKGGVATSYINLGSVSIKMNRYGDAKKYIENGLMVAKEIGNKKSIKEGFRELSVLDSIENDMGGAFENYKMFIVYRDSLFNEENAEKAYASQMQYQIEDDQRREEEAEERRLRDIKRRDTVQFFVIFLIVLIVFGAVMLLGKFKIPPGLAQGLSFVALLLVFESILVFTDPFLDVYTKGVPVYKLLINIVLAIIIFPVNRFLENKFKKRLKVD
jgi:tetratricopeptide (TPR) repeat protein